MIFWERVEPVHTDRLEAAVLRAYSVFSRYRLNGLIEFCDCSVCMSREQARELCTTPLEEIGSDLLSEYTNSAHGYDRTMIEPQFKYFLPRYLDLIARCDPPHDGGVECSLDRLGAAGYRTAWPEDECAAIDEFFDAFVAASLDQLMLLEWPVGLHLEFDMGDVLVMIVRAGGDLDRVLDVFERGRDPEAAVHMASLRSEITIRKGEAVFHNHLLSDFPDAGKRIGTWLMQDGVTERIVEAVGLLDDPNYDDVLAMGMV